jgi:hypothetical protein
MLGGADETALNEVRSVIQQYDPDALEDLQSLVEIGRLEYAEPKLDEPTTPTCDDLRTNGSSAE